jgi:ABC-2 type transport system permease protein
MNKISFGRQFLGFLRISTFTLLRSRAAVFFGFVFPITFIIIFGLISGGGNSKVNLGIDSQSLKDFPQIANILKQTEIFNIKEGDLTSLEEKITKPSSEISEQLSGIIHITQVDDKVNIEIFENPANPQDVAIIKQAVGTISDKLTIAENSIDSRYQIQSTKLASRVTRFIDFALPGILGFSLLSTGINSVAFSFLSLRKGNVLKRLFAAPIFKTAFIMGHALARAIFSLVQNLVLILVATLFFQYSPANGLSSYWQMLVIVLLGILTFMGFGYLVAGLSKKDDQVNVVGQLLFLPQVLLSGTFFTVTSLPIWLQSVVRFMPLTLFNDSMRFVAVNGYNLWDSQVYNLILILLVWIVVTYLIVARVFKFN